MKTIGLIAGMSWESSLEYYRIINRRVAQRLGGFHSARSLMYSVDFAEIEELQRTARWAEATEAMVDCALRLKRGGADFLVICTNTMHNAADEVADRSGLPLLHIADAAGERVRQAGHRRIGLLGTRFTMEGGFYAQRLEERFGLEVVTPPADERAVAHDIIYDELVKGTISAGSRDRYLRIIAHLAEAGAEAILLACTEIGLLVKQADVRTPLFDTMEIHAVAAADLALSPGEQRRERQADHGCDATGRA